MSSEQKPFDRTETLKNNPAVGLAVKLRSQKFTPKQIAFILNFAGDPINAAQKAGYKHPLAQRALLKNKRIIKAIIKRDKLLDKLPQKSDPIMDVHQLRQWWTKRIVDNVETMSHRISCSKLLAQSYGAFFEPGKGEGAKITVNILGITGENGSGVEIAEERGTKENILIEGDLT